MIVIYYQKKKYLKSGRGCLSRATMTSSLVTEPGKAWEGQTLRDEEERAEVKKRLEGSGSSKSLIQMNFKDKGLF